MTFVVAAGTGAASGGARMKSVFAAIPAAMTTTPRTPALQLFGHDDIEARRAFSSNA